MFDDNSLEKSPEFRQVAKEIKDEIVEKQAEGLATPEELSENIGETRETIEKELGLEGRELEEATAEALVYVAEETIKDARSAELGPEVSTEEDAIETTQAVLVEAEEKGLDLPVDPVQTMVDDGYGPEVNKARKAMENGDGGAEEGELFAGYDKKVPETHVAQEEIPKLQQLLKDTYDKVQASDIEEGLKAQILEDLKSMSDANSSEMTFSESKAPFEPIAQLSNFAYNSKSNYDGLVASGQMDDDFKVEWARADESTRWLMAEFGKIAFATAESAEKIAEMQAEIDAR